ncbi:amino acid permease/ SLC12A domain-containing protein [Obelidium mucronatum]|nr:amino acid permease/ SLC12A domain-containing protein [Obelidium mucronatum]
MEDSNTALVAEIAPEGHLQRKLQVRHLEMIAIGGTIGTGLLLKSGGAIFTAGPLGALICYIIVGIQGYAVTVALGEMATLIPVSGAFSHFPGRFVSPALGLCSGWNYWLNWAVSIPTEMSAVAQFMLFWPNPLPSWVWSAIFYLPIAAVNLISVLSFGEIEFFLSIIKVIAVMVFLMVGFCVWFGAGSNTGPLWFKNWNPAIVGDSGINKFLNLASGFTTAFFSYGGTELVGLTAAEADNPRKAVPRAINGTFYRILIFYVAAIFLVGVLIPPSSEILNPYSEGGITQSPFVYVWNIIGISAAANIMNFVIIVAILSTVNSAVYACSRTLLRLAEDGDAPAIFKTVNSRGIPVNATLLSLAFGVAALIANYADASGQFFNFLSSLFPAIAWIIISFTHLRFRWGYVAQGRSLSDLPYVAPYFPYLDYAALTIGFYVIAYMFFSAFYQVTNFDANWFMSNSWVYCGYPIVLTLFVFGGWFHSKKTGNGFWSGFKLVPFEEMDFETDRLVETPEQIAQNNALMKRSLVIQRSGRSEFWPNSFESENRFVPIQLTASSK